MKTLRGRIITGAALLLLVFWVSGSFAAEKNEALATGAYQVSAIDFLKAESGFSLMIKGNSQPTFTVYELFDPLRVVIDIADASIDSALQLPIELNQGPVASVAGSILTEKKPHIAKLEIFLADDRKYSVNRTEKDIILLFAGEGEVQGDSVKSPAVSEKDIPGFEIKDVSFNVNQGSVTVSLVADDAIRDFKKAELPASSDRPARFYIDLPGFKAPGLEPIIKVNEGGLAKIRIADRDNGLRIVFDSQRQELFDYEIDSVENGLQVVITGGVQVVAAVDPVSELLASKSAPKSSADRPEEQKTAPVVSEQLKNAGVSSDLFAAAGYDRQKISVDFYKINLHNVFRLIGEVSGYNMVIDDSVSGSLTLTLDQVPWDFVLDVIMNLKNLQKEERYNTIVISPKSKAFAWPESKKNELQIKAPPKDVEIAISNKLNQSPEKMAAKMLVQRGNKLANDGNLKEALSLFEDAFAKWPDNAALAKRIAGICLVKLGYNQKGVYYAKKALQIDPDDSEAALQAAIGLANMRQGEAQKYFDIATSVEKPTKAALFSAASFAEDSNDFAAALKITSRYEDFYGPSLETMITKARVLDKQGLPKQAAEMYKAVLYSGYQLDDDLARYIKGRIALDN